MRARRQWMPFAVALALLLSGTGVGTGVGTAAAAPSGKGRSVGTTFVKRSGADLRLGRQPFRFAGTNNYYLHYKSQLMTDAVLEKAAASGFTVVRTWGWFDIGNEDDSNSVAGKQDGTYIQYWDPQTGHPAYNDGSSGLGKLDYVIAKARQQGLRLVIPFTNNWSDFGGMDQYVRWAGLDSHDDFYTDPTIRQWFKDYIAHLLNRTNSITGIKYKDDPTILMWELANEPRCVGSGVYPRSGNCTTETITSWADDVSTFIKTVDDKHLVGVGDEGFFCDPGHAVYEYNCRSGVDTVALAKLPNVDVLSFHLYPDHWRKDAAWGTEWIKQHIDAAEQVGKPVVLGEFGWHDKSDRNLVYREWTDTAAGYRGGVDGALYWILSDIQTPGSLYPDYDGFTIYCPSPVCTTLGNFSERMRSGRTSFPPVADDDSATTDYGTGVTVEATYNDIAYDGATIDARTLDLAPAAAGRQTSYAATDGTFAADDTGQVTFTPADGFVGRSRATYAVQDTNGRASNVATVTVIVNPSPTEPQTLFSFEDGTQGWAGASWQTDAGTVAQESGYATDGTSSLRVSSNNAWFSVQFAQPQDWTTRTRLAFDLTRTTGTTATVALQLGDSWSWCQYTGSWQNAPTTVEVDLAPLDCAADRSKVHSLLIWFNDGEHNIDRVRVS